MHNIEDVKEGNIKSDNSNRFKMIDFIRGFLDSVGNIKDDNSALSEDLQNLKKEVFDKKDNWTAEAIKGAFAGFSEIIKPQRSDDKGDDKGASFDPIGPESEFVKYLIAFAVDDPIKLGSALQESFNILAESSLVSKEVQNVFFQSYYPPTGEDLLCLGGTGSRGLDTLRQLAASAALSNALAMSAYQATMAEMTGKASKYIAIGNQVHIPRYLEYLLNFITEEELKDKDSNWSTTSNIPTPIAAQIYQDFLPLFTKRLTESLKPEELKVQEQVKSKIDAIKKEITQSLQTSIEGLEDFDDNAVEKARESNEFKELINGRITEDVFYNPDVGIIGKAFAKFYKSLGQITTEHKLNEGALAINKIFAEEEQGEHQEDSQEKVTYYQLQWDKLPEIITQSISESIKDQIEKSGFNEALAPATNNPAIDIYFDEIAGEINRLLDSSYQADKAQAVMILYLLSNRAPGAPIHHFVKILDDNDGNISKKLEEIAAKKELPEYYLEKITDGGIDNKKTGILQRYESYQRYFEDLAKITNEVGNSNNQNNLAIILSGSTKSGMTHIDNLLKKGQLKDALDANLTTSNMLGIPGTAEKEIDYLMLRGDAEAIIGKLITISKGNPDHVSKDFIGKVLRSACRYNKIDIVTALLASVEEEKDRVAVINQANNNGSTPLYIAAQEGHEEVVKALLASVEKKEHKLAIINQARSSDGVTPLFIAAQNGHKEVVTALLKPVAEEEHRLDVINKPNKNGTTPLYVAAQKGHKEVVTALLTSVAKESRLVVINQADKNGATPLFIAAQNGHKEVVTALLAKDADINKSNKNGTTPLLIAAQNGHKEVVIALLAKDADINKSNKNGTTPLSIAAQNGHKGVVTALLASVEKKEHKLAVINQPYQDGSTPLLIAAQNGHKEVVTALLESVAEGNKVAVINQANQYGTTPLFIAAQNGHDEVVTALLTSVAKESRLDVINQPCQDGATPLYIAACNGHDEVVTALLTSVAKESRLDVINQPYQDGSTPLYIAAQNGHKGVVTALLENGANINKSNKNGSTPLYIAAQQGHKEVVTALLAKDADINKPNKNGATPLFIAAKKGHKEVVTDLLANGASINNSDLDFWHINKDNKGCKEFIKEVKKCHKQLKRIVSGLGKYPCCSSRGIPQSSLEEFTDDMADNIKGAVLNMQDSGGNILAYAVRNNKPDTFKILKESGAKDNITVRYKSWSGVVHERPMQYYIKEKVTNPSLFNVGVANHNRPLTAVQNTKASRMQILAHNTEL